MSTPIIIIGTGLAGYQLAREFRKLDAATPLLIITADAGDFYSKPLLSTALTQKKTAVELATANAAAMATQLNADVRTHCTVSAVDTITKTITLGTECIAYAKLVLAVGAEVIKAPLTGDGAESVYSINHLADYAVFQDAIKDKKHITILGAGLIGCEFANDLTNHGYEVHMIAPVLAPLDLLVPKEVGQLLQAALTANGVHFHFGCVVNEVNKADDGYRLLLSNGETLSTECVLSAIGLRPRTALASAAHILVDRGVLVNRYLETSQTDVYALGDCAEVEGHVLPYITPLLNSARALAKTLAGERTEVAYPAMPVTVKTPIHPIVVCPPPKNMAGEWRIEQEGNGARALFYDTNQQLFGFVLTDSTVKERLQWAKQIPSLF